MTAYYTRSLEKKNTLISHLLLTLVELGLFMQVGLLVQMGPLVEVCALVQQVSLVQERISPQWAHPVVA